MEKRRELPMPGEYYRHFKGNLYEVLTVATHSETEEKLVIYRALYGSRQDYARPVDMFLSEVDHDKYPEAAQQYRFQRVGDCVHGMQEDSEGERSSQGESGFVLERSSQSRSGSAVERLCRSRSESGMEEVSRGQSGQVETGDERTADPAADASVLICFLNAEGLQEKLEVIRQNRTKIDERFIDGAAMALDMVVREGDLDDRLRDLCRQLQLMAQYESRRLR